ncbi:hypothetical protein KAJ02_08205, partial [Candidatus Bipolaricaulota bacterium]|nr:hypothetical protein [Candidatus Bipolaricaulota bacterium]
MRRILVMLLAGCLMFTITLSAATGQFVAVEIEAFESWGVLHWGTWSPLEEELMTTRVLQASEEDDEAVIGILDACSTSDMDSSERGSCNALARFYYVREAEYGLTPLLGRPYRIQLRNLTSG